MTDWTDDLPPSDPPTVRRIPADRAHRDYVNTVSAVARMTNAVRLLHRRIPGACQDRLDGLHAPDLVVLVAALQDLRREIGMVEAYAVREIGRDEFATEQRQGTLPDGRPYQVLKGADRKGWDHDSWKRDVRAQVLSGVPETLIDPDSGEAVQVADLLAAVQEVHGSTAPRVAQLRALGLSPGDYSETTPGPWTLKVSAAPTTTTEG